MAHFYTSCVGSRGETHRLGGRDSGASATVATYRGGCTVRGYVDKNGVDCVSVRLRRWEGAGVELDIYDGPINGPVPAKATKRPNAKR